MLQVERRVANLESRRQFSHRLRFRSLEYETTKRREACRSAVQKCSAVRAEPARGRDSARPGLGPSRVTAEHRADTFALGGV